MSESNSNPSDENNQEQPSPSESSDSTSSEKPEGSTLTEEPNQEAILDSAMREKDSLAADERDTIAPAAEHGWLEQFEAFGAKAWAELEAVAGQGLQAEESVLLVTLAVKLVKLALVHDPEALDKFDTALDHNP